MRSNPEPWWRISRHRSGLRLLNYGRHSDLSQVLPLLITGMLGQAHTRTTANLPMSTRKAQVRPSLHSLYSLLLISLYHRYFSLRIFGTSIAFHLAHTESPFTSPQHSCGGVPNLRTTPDTSHDAPHLPHLPHTPNSSPSRPWLTRRVVQSDDRDAPLSSVASEPRRQCSASHLTARHG